MKKWFIVVLASLVLFGSSIFSFEGVTALEVIEHTDSTGDVENVGIEDSDLHDNIDITSLSADTSGDPIILELTTLAGITIDASGIDYHYYFYLDVTGDDTTDLIVTITEDDQYISGDLVDGTNSPISDYSGEGTSTLTIELPLDLFTTAPTVDDVSVCAEIRDGGYLAHDYTNKDFTGDVREVEITLPSDNEDPNDANPTNPSLEMAISSFNMEISTTDSSYDYTMTATGTGSDDFIKEFYCIWAYGEGGGVPQQSWEGSPIDEDHSYGSHEYKEEFFGTGPERSWSTWKWTFHSQGPIDDNNRARYEDPASYWGPIDHMLLYIRGYANDSTWDQDSEDITKEYTGIDPSSADDDDSTIDDDTTDDDTTVDDDTTDDDTSDDDGDDSPGFEMVIIVSAVILASIFIIRRKRN